MLLRNGDWELTLFIAVSWTFFEFFEPKTYDANTMERKEEHRKKQVNSFEYFNDNI